MRTNCTKVYKAPYGTYSYATILYVTSQVPNYMGGSRIQQRHLSDRCFTLQELILNNTKVVGPNSSLRDAFDIRIANRCCMTHCCTASINVRCATLVLNVKRIYLSKRGSNWGGGMETVGWRGQGRSGVGGLIWTGGNSQHPRVSPGFHGNPTSYWIDIDIAQFTPLTSLPCWADLLNSVGCHVTKLSSWKLANKMHIHKLFPLTFRK